MIYYRKEQSGKYTELTWIMYQPNGSSLWVRVNYASFNLLYTWINVSTEEPTHMEEMTEKEGQKLMKLIFKVRKIKKMMAQET